MCQFWILPSFPWSEVCNRTKMFHVKHFGTIAEAFRTRRQVRGAARHRPGSAASTEAEARPSADKPDRV
jgi:hypothetical protein